MLKLYQIIFLFIFLFLSCNSNPNKIDRNMTPSIEAYENRKIYRELTVAIIDSIEDMQLLQVVFDNLSEQLPKDYSKHYDFITLKFNSSQQAIYLSWWLEAEVNNGGFNQYFANTDGQYAELLPSLLNKMKAYKISNLVKDANLIYNKHYQSITQNQDGTVEEFSKSYEDNPLNDLDNKFYKLYESENLTQKQIDFIRNHKEDFVTKD